MGNSDSKFEFRRRITQLVSKPVATDDHEYWKVVFVSSLRMEEVLQLVQPKDIRLLKHKQPGNLAVLLFKAIEQLRLFVSNDTKHDYSSARTSLRLLTRVLPFVFEGDVPPTQLSAPESDSSAEEAWAPAAEMDSLPRLLPEGYDFVDAFFWRNKFINTGGEEQEFTEIADEPLKLPLGHLLMRTLQRVCFYPGFTVVPARATAKPEPSTEFPGLDSRLLWAGGLASGKTVIPPAHELDLNRIDALRCLLACFSMSLYSKDALVVNPFIRAFFDTEPEGTGEAVNYPLTLFVSLVNTIVTYNPAGILPYTSYVVGDHERVIDYALHVLLTGMDYPPTTPPATSSSGASASASPIMNVFWAAARMISQEAQYQLVFNGLVLLLRNKLNAQNTYLPSSQRLLECHAELLILLWKFIDCNKAFRQHICKRLDVCELVVCLLHYIHESSKEHSRFGILQISVFILLCFSAERDFGVALNKPALQGIPGVQLPLFNGNHMDCLVLVLHSLFFVKNSAWIKAIHDSCLSILANVSAYCKSMAMVSAMKLVNLVDHLTLPKRLAKADQRTLANAGMLLEIFNNILQYQFEGNTQLVYAIVRSRTVFERIAEHVRAEQGGSHSNTPRANTTPHHPTGKSKLSDQLPVHVITRMLHVLGPELESFCKGKATVGEGEVLDFLKSTTLVGLLPVPHPIVIRKFEFQPATYAWVHMWTWGVVYLRGCNSPLFDASTIKLFVVTTAQQQQQQQQEQRQDTPPQTQQPTTPAQAPADRLPQAPPVLTVLPDEDEAKKAKVNGTSTEKSSPVPPVPAATPGSSAPPAKSAEFSPSVPPQPARPNSLPPRKN